MPNQTISRFNQALITQNFMLARQIAMNELNSHNINEYDNDDLLSQRRAIDCAIEYCTPLTLDILLLVCTYKPDLNLSKLGMRQQR